MKQLFLFAEMHLDHPNQKMVWYECQNLSPIHCQWQNEHQLFVSTSASPFGSLQSFWEELTAQNQHKHKTLVFPPPSGGGKTRLGGSTLAKTTINTNEAPCQKWHGKSKEPLLKFQSISLAGWIEGPARPKVRALSFSDLEMLRLRHSILNLDVGCLNTALTRSLHH